MKPRIYADFLKRDDRGRLILTCRGTAEDMRRLTIDLVAGLSVVFYMDDADDAGNPDDLEVEGEISFDVAHNRWVGVIDEGTWRHRSEVREPNQR